MIKFIHFFTLLFIFSCSSVVPIHQKEALKTKTVEKKTLEVIEPVEITIAKAQVKLIKMKGLPSGQLYCGDKLIRYESYSGELTFFLSVNYFETRKKLKCEFKNGETIALLTIVDFPYASERLNVDKKRVFLSKKNLARVIKEKKELDLIYSASSRRPYFSGPFSLPLNSYITSKFGNKRVFNKKKHTAHLGTDFRAAVGKKIPSTNKGVVVYTGNLFYTGNTIIIDHGLGVLSIYAHLSKINVQVGDQVGKMENIGLAGATGRVSGPHLHWGLRVNGNRVDGHSLVKESQLYGR